MLFSSGNLLWGNYGVEVLFEPGPGRAGGGGGHANLNLSKAAHNPRGGGAPLLRHRAVWWEGWAGPPSEAAPPGT